MSTTEIERLNRLADHIFLLTTLGEVVTLQIDLNDLGEAENLFEEEFTDSEKDGLYLNSMLLQRKMENYNCDYHGLFDRIAALSGDYNTVDSVTALLRISFRNSHVEVTVQIDGFSDPNLLQTTDNALFFEIMNLIKTRWAFAKNAMRAD